MIRSCKDCKDRYLGCHDKCPRYLAEKAKIEEVNERRRKEQQSVYIPNKKL